MVPRTPEKHRAKVNLITGFLGAGKTTCIGSLLARKPPGEKWAVIVNEFGKVAIDGAMLRGRAKGSLLREVSGGCLCCTLNPPLQVALTDLLRRERPDRILIEPTGLGHPAGILAVLGNPWLRDHLEPGATLCLLDPGQLADPARREDPTFRDQLHAADCVIVSKTDIVRPEAVREALSLSLSLRPRKAWTVRARNGDVPLSCLEMPGRAALPFLEQNSRRPVHGGHATHAHSDGSVSGVRTGGSASPKPRGPGAPARVEDSGLGHSGCGWIFHVEDCFDLARLPDALGLPRREGEASRAPPVVRAKGYLRTPTGWVFVNGTETDWRIDRAAAQEDSRLEILVEGGSPAWGALHADLMRCML